MGRAPPQLAKLCLEGSILYKQSLPKVRAEPKVRGQHYASKAEVKAAMRYKGPPE